MATTATKENLTIEELKAQLAAVKGELQAAREKAAKPKAAPSPKGVSWKTSKPGLAAQVVLEFGMHTSPVDEQVRARFAKLAGRRNDAEDPILLANAWRTLRVALQYTPEEYQKDLAKANK